MTNPFGFDASGTVTMVWQIAWQSTVILGLGLMASKIVPMRPSRAHRILLASALACLIVQPLSIVARRLDFGMLAPVREAAPEAAIPAPAIPVPRTVAFERAVPSINESSQEETSGTLGPIPSPSRPISARPTFLAVSMVSVLAIAWVVFSTISLWKLVASFVVGRNLKETAAILSEPDLLAASAAASRNLGLPMTPEVRVSRHVRCPVVWCWGRRPVLILPATMIEQSSRVRSQCSAILCHELAHWKRADHLSALVTEILTCVLPWQPLAWVFRTRMADLSELACDDWALTHASAVPATDYAEALLGLVIDRRRPLVPAAVSRRSGLAARVRHILEETTPRPRTGRLWSAVIVGVSLGLVAIVALAQTRQTRAIAAEKVGHETESKSPWTTVEGTVRGEKGEGLAGAEVLWIGPDQQFMSNVARPRDDPDWGKMHMKTLSRATSDDKGRFSVRARIDKPTLIDRLTQLVAHKDGLAPASAIAFLDGKDVEIRLEPAVEIVGKLLTPGGDPASGVEVRLSDYSNGQWRDIRALRHMEFGERAIWKDRPAYYPGTFRTDDAGRFAIKGFVPAGMFATLDLRHPDYAVDELTISTGKSAEPTPDQAAFSVRPLLREFTYTLAAARPVVGTVRDAETKKPLEGITVQVTPMRKHGGMAVTTVTDREGKYRVSDREGQNYWVTAFPRQGTGYLPSSQGMLKWPAGESELRVDLPLRRGIVLRGKVLDEETGKPLPHVSVVYQPRRGNGNVAGKAEFRSPALTDSEGNFAVNGVRGPGVVVAEAPPGDYIRHTIAPADFGHNSSVHVHGLARVDVPAMGEAASVVIKLKKGFTLEARAVRPDGSTAEMVRAWCSELKARLLDNWVSPDEFPNGIFRLPGAEPGRTYRVFFLDPDLKFGKLVEIKADPSVKGPVEIKLEPTATILGRVLDADGAPIKGAQILPNMQLVDKGSKLSERDRYDHDATQIYTMFTGEPLLQVYPAEFEYKGLIPGVRYFVTWYSREGVSSWHAVEPLKPGENRAVGDLRTEKKGGKDEN